MAQYVSEENLQLYDKLLKEYILTKSESLLDLLSYGVEWDTEVADPHLTRIGNLNWHRTLPIQSLMRRCIALKEKIMYWLDPNDGRFREDNKDYIFTSEVGTIVENDITYYTITNSTAFSDLGYKRLYIKINSIIGLIIDITDNTAKIKLEGTLDVGTYEIELGSRTNGYDGTVEVYVPEFYIRSFINGTKRLVRISPFLIDSSWLRLKRCLLDAFRCTILNTVPENMGFLSTLPVLSAISVANVETYCRGGINRVGYDLYLETDPFRTDLGKPVSGKALSVARSCARLSLKEVLSYILYKNICYWLYVIEYANFNSQEDYNSLLSIEGYKLGGLGKGVSTVNYDNLSYYNNANPITPNGFSLEIGNNTGIKYGYINTPTESGGDPNRIFEFNVISYRGIENLFGDIYTCLDGIIVKEDNSRLAVYVTDNPDDYGSLNNMIIIGHQINLDGHIKEFDLGNLANILPSSTGGSTTTYMCDKANGLASGILLRAVRIGGKSTLSFDSGIACWFSTAAIDSSSGDRGFRLIQELD